MTQSRPQREQARWLLAERGMARLSELRDAGVTAATISRMEHDGEVVRLARGLYQLPDAPLDGQHTLAEVAKRMPKGVVCLVSALAFHELTDQIPRQIWVAIGKKDWSPKDGEPPVRIVRFTEALLADGVETHTVESISVRIFGVAKTVADCFRHRRTVGISVAIEGLQEALRQRKTTPSELAEHAARGGIATVMRPYLEALTANG